MDLTTEEKIIEAGVDSLYQSMKTIERKEYISYNYHGVVPMQSMPAGSYEYITVTKPVLYTKLTLACHNNDLAKVTKLLGEGADVNTVPLEIFNSSKNVLSGQIRENYMTIQGSPLYEVLRVSRYNINTLEIIKLLIEKGANINYKDESTLLEIMCRRIDNSTSDFIISLLQEIFKTQHTEQKEDFLNTKIYFNELPLYKIIEEANKNKIEYNKNNYDIYRQIARTYLHIAKFLAENGAKYGEREPSGGITTYISKKLDETQSIRSKLTNLGRAIGVRGGRRTRFRKSRKIRRTRRNR